MGSPSHPLSRPTKFRGIAAALLLANAMALPSLGYFTVQHDQTLGPQVTDWGTGSGYPEDFYFPGSPLIPDTPVDFNSTDVYGHTLPTADPFYGGDPTKPLQSVILTWTLTVGPITYSYEGNANNTITIVLEGYKTAENVPSTLFLSDTDGTLLDLTLFYAENIVEDVFVPADTPYNGVFPQFTEGDDVTYVDNDIPDFFTTGSSFDVPVGTYGRSFGDAVGGGDTTFIITWNAASTLSVTYVYLPEPTTWGAMGVGLLGTLGMYLRRRKA